MNQFDWKLPPVCVIDTSLCLALLPGMNMEFIKIVSRSTSRAHQGRASVVSPCVKDILTVGNGICDWEESMEKNQD